MEKQHTAPSRRMRRLPRLALTLLLAIGVLTVVGSDPASADTPRRFRNVSTLFCLESDIFTIGHHGINTNNCNGSVQQQWHVHFDYTNYGGNIMNYTAGVCLDSNAAGRVYGNPCTGHNSYQEWTFESDGHAWLIRNVATGFCLDSNAARQVYTSRVCGSNNFQRWIIPG
jgi:Ricin-type beta-trefoil lectin domain